MKIRFEYFNDASMTTIIYVDEKKYKVKGSPLRGSFNGNLPEDFPDAYIEYELEEI